MVDEENIGKIEESSIQESLEESSVSVKLTYEDAQRAFESDVIDCSPLLDDPDRYPLIATGFFNWDEEWYFYRTDPIDDSYDLEFTEFYRELER